MKAATFEQIMTDKVMRLEVASTLIGFELVYLPHYLSLPMADFHPDMLSSLGDWRIQRLAMAGFRGCTKSTNAGLSLPLFSVVRCCHSAFFPLGLQAPHHRTDTNHFLAGILTVLLNLVMYHRLT